MAEQDLEQLAGVRAGQILAGKYRVERVLGVGGMGAVVAAYHMQLDYKVAIKFLLPALLAKPEAVIRFANEARNCVKIQNEHVARVQDVGTLDDGAPYMVMEFLQGEDLSAWLRERGALPIEEAVDFVLQACVAVADAHGLGIVHRDLKPSNLYCVRRSDGQWIIKVLDFGISKVTDVGRHSEPAAMGMTKTSAVMGSPQYMSPEQVTNSKDVDTRTDLWALGVILYELLTGTAPFQGEALVEIGAKIAVQEPAPVRSYRPDVPPALEAVIRKCLEKDRQRRYFNVAELALALLPFAPRRSKALVEQITGIIQAAGLSATALSVPESPLQAPQVPWEAPPATQRAPQVPWEAQQAPHATQQAPQAPQVAPGSVAPWSGPPEAPGGKKAVLWGGVALGLLGGAAGVVLIARYWPHPHPPPPPLHDGDRALAEAGAAPDCAPDATRCDGATLLTCSAGRWATGSVTAGQCGAVCSPGLAAQCSGNTPQTCASTGQWESGSPCPYVCSAGACAGLCAPGRTQCAGGGVQTCGSDGQWQKPVLCGKSSACRDGACAVVWTQQLHNCEPNYTVDPKSGAHVFKPECFAK